MGLGSSIEHYRLVKQISLGLAIKTFPAEHILVQLETAIDSSSSTCISRLTRTYESTHFSPDVYRE
jgi:hypothetical protein